MATSADSPYFGPTARASRPQDAAAIILPVPYEATVSYGHGTADGPAAIREASQQVELFDDELAVDVSTGGFYSAEPVELASCDGPEAMRRIRQAAATWMAHEAFVLSLGGEHSLSPPLVEAAVERFGELSVLQIDAHADLRDTYEDDRLSHACAMRRIREIDGVARDTVAVGIRNCSQEEYEYARAEGIELLFARNVAGRTDWIERAVERLGPRVYVTIDVDGLDPSVIPATGTPEPGGLGWYETLALLRAICRRRQVVAADIVELAPAPGSHVSEFAAALLAYRLLTYRLASSRA